jgi:hypothetical protein
MHQFDLELLCVGDSVVQRLLRAVGERLSRIERETVELQMAGVGPIAKPISDNASSQRNWTRDKSPINHFTRPTIAERPGSNSCLNLHPESLNFTSIFTQNPPDNHSKCLQCGFQIPKVRIALEKQLKGMNANMCISK